jgi:hypothetical protein
MAQLTRPAANDAGRVRSLTRAGHGLARGDGHLLLVADPVVASHPVAKLAAEPR